jgi:hypothetical protein
VAAVELGTHLHDQVTCAQRLEGADRVRRRQREVAAQRDKCFHRTAAHRLDRFDGTQSVFARRVEPADLAEPIEECCVRAVVDAAGAVALDVAVSPDWAGSRALPADVAPQEQQVDYLPYGVDAMLVLCDPETLGDDQSLGPQVRVGERVDCLLVHAAALY